MSRRRAVVRALGVWGGASLLRMSGAVTRLRFLHLDREVEAMGRHGAVIYALWHGRMWLLAARFPRRGVGVLVSLSEDGEVMARILARLRLVPVRGSSSRGGEEAMRALEEWVDGGGSAAITPDGPRGPRHVARMGAVALAARTGKPIVPVGAAARSAWTLGSWDAFQIPRPGSRAVIAIGEPLLVPPLADLETYRRRLEAALNDAEAMAEREALR
jgi:lysophospholipid acyltransferase (LPLAT)-like uncharacterized protein